MKTLVGMMPIRNLYGKTIQIIFDRPRNTSLAEPFAQNQGAAVGDRGKIVECWQRGEIEYVRVR